MNLKPFLQKIRQWKTFLPTYKKGMQQPSPQEFLEVAKLAKLISSGLNEIDKTTVERRTNGPSNKIDMNAFIHNVTSAARGEVNQNNPNYNPNNPDNLAPSVDEELIRQMVPDAQPANSVPQQPQVSPLVDNNKPSGVIGGAYAVGKGTNDKIFVDKDFITKKDFLKLVKSMDKIGNVLEKLLNEMYPKNIKSDKPTLINE